MRGVAAARQLCTLPLGASPFSFFGPLLHPPPFRSDPDDPYRLTDATRTLGMVVCRGTQVQGREKRRGAITCSANEAMRTVACKQPCLVPFHSCAFVLAPLPPCLFAPCPFFPRHVFRCQCQVSLISPTDGCEEIANPFLNPEE